MPQTDPIRPTDDDARNLAQGLLRGATYGALGVLVDGAPMVTRVAVGMAGADPLILVSTLSEHTRALLADPACSLLVGEPGPKGDPLTHPRLTLQCLAESAEKATHRGAWLDRHPKSKLYIDFGDFLFLRLAVQAAHLNGGFGKAFRLTASDLGAA